MSKVGLGLRRDIAEDTIQLEDVAPDFLEIAPENWMSMGGYWRNVLNRAAERYSLTAHGLSLSIGSPDPLNVDFVKRVKTFLDDFNIEIYSEHLSYSQSQNAHLYDLLPIPFRQDAVTHIVERIQQVQDILQRPLTLENVSYYTPVAAEMKESEFISEIVRQSGCKLLLDVNNVYVNAFNHNYNAQQFITELPLDSVGYIHMAGHEKVAEDLIIDTHGSDIIDPVFELFEWTIQRMHSVPVLLERDFNLPEVNHLQKELSHLKSIANSVWNHKTVAHAEN